MPAASFFPAPISIQVFDIFYIDSYADLLLINSWKDDIMKRKMTMLNALYYHTKTTNSI